MTDAIGIKDAVYAIGGAIIIGISKYLDNRQGRGIDTQIDEQKTTSTETVRRLDALGKIDDKQWEVIDDLKKADISHEKEDWKMKSELDLKIASLDGIVGRLDGKMDSIGDKIAEMQKSIFIRLDKIESSMNKN